MDVSIKQFNVEMQIKNKGVELEVRHPTTGEQLGDLIVNKTRLIWCKGQQTKEGAVKAGQTVTWPDFIKWMEQG